MRIGAACDRGSRTREARMRPQSLLPPRANVPMAIVARRDEVVQRWRASFAMHHVSIENSLVFLRHTVQFFLRVGSQRDPEDPAIRRKSQWRWPNLVRSR